MLSPYAPPRVLELALVGALVLGCSGRDRPDSGFSPEEGVVVAKPDGGFFVADRHQGGRATRLRLLEIGWGRLVDVHDVDATGQASPTPILRDVVIGESVLSDGDTMTLETHPVTHATRLILKKTHGVDDGSGVTFESLLARATGALAPLLPKAADGTASLPVSVVARDAALLLRFDDLLADGPELASAIFEFVRLATGYPPTTPSPARMRFDPAHGGIADGEFHSTRILIDLSVTEREAAELPYFVPVGPAGVPASSTFSLEPNVALRLVTRTDPADGRMLALTNLAGRALQPEGPVEVATGDVVRAWRSGNANDVNAGFLLDLTEPRVVGSFALVIEEARGDADGPAGFAFEVDARFETPCRFAAATGDALVLGGELYELAEPAAEPDSEGRVRGLALTRLALEPLDDARLLLGCGELLAPYREEAQLDPACWIAFVPPAREPPGRGIASESEVLVRFSEPMDPATFRAFDSFRLLRGALRPDTVVTATDIVVGDVRAAASLQEFRFQPRLPLDNTSGEYRFELGATLEGVRDLTGTRLENVFEVAEFTLDPTEPPRANAGFALRFQEEDELLPPGLADVRGQVTYDIGSGGILRPRPTAFASYTADQRVPVLSITGFWPLGVQTPLSPLGSKVQMLWRYADFNWRVRDERYHNMDVLGLYWSPLAGRLISDLFPLFEMRLGHSLWKPDEAPQTNGAPRYPFSGLPALGKFDDNYLVSARGGPVVVHPRSLGYRVRPADMTSSTSGTPLLPFPWNRSGASPTSYTWRDTALLGKGDLRGAGVPMDIEVGDPLRLDTGIGSYYPTGQVPSVGLPLLWEIRCFPNSAGLGFNSLDVLLVFPGWSTPNCRAFSTGGIDTSGQPFEKDPDLEIFPSGGFNPNSSPPGLATPLVADNSYYIGQIDTVVRLSRAVTIWIDTGTTDPRYVAPVLEPRVQPDGTSVLPEFRGAHDFSLDALDAPFDAARLDPYGDFRPGTTQFLGDGDWSPDIHAANGARFLQVRFTFFNNTEVGLSPELDSFGVAYERGP